MSRPTEAATLHKVVEILSQIGNWKTSYLPCNYLVLDIETTGFSSTKNRVVSIGLCAVQNCEIAHELHEGDSSNMILKWPIEVFDGCDKAIEIHGIDYHKSQELGLEPADAMGILAESIAWARDNNMYIVGHNMLKFDAPFIGMEMQRAGLDTRIEGNEVIDTAALCKSMQLHILPGLDETVMGYFQRVMAIRAKGIFFNLDRYCVERFGMIEKYGVDPQSAHDSGYDCWLTHLVLQELNKMLDIDESIPSWDDVPGDRIGYDDVLF